MEGVMRCRKPGIGATVSLRPRPPMAQASRSANDRFMAYRSRYSVLVDWAVPPVSESPRSACVGCPLHKSHQRGPDLEQKKPLRACTPFVCLCILTNASGARPDESFVAWRRNDC